MNDAHRFSDGIFRLELTRAIVADYQSIKEEAARRMMDFPVHESPHALGELEATLRAAVDAEKLLEALDADIAEFYADEFEAIEFWSKREGHGTSALPVPPTAPPIFDQDPIGFLKQRRREVDQISERFLELADEVRLRPVTDDDGLHFRERHRQWKYQIAQAYDEAIEDFQDLAGEHEFPEGQS